MKKIFICGSREIYRNYAEALSFCGVAGIFSEHIENAEDCRGLLLPGGADIDPALYGAENLGSQKIDRERDLQELQLVRDFCETNRPILGICKGLQILQVAFGGSLIQDIPTADAHKWEEATGDKVHAVTASPKGFLFSLYGGQFSVNSAHHQAAGEPAPGLSVAAKAGDGVIEALEAPSRKIYAVQWHPERMAFHHRRNDTVDGRILFEFFLSLC